MRNFVLTTLLVFIFNVLAAQYNTPGTGVNYNLDDLVQYSSGAVTIEPSGQFHFNQDITLSVNDTLTILSGAAVNMMDNVLVTIQGIMIVQPPVSEIVFFKAFNNYFKGFRFESSSGSSLARTFFKKAGGIRLVSSDVSFYQCDFADFNQEYTSGTLDLFQSSPSIHTCSFTNNLGPAVMSAANGSSSPQVIGCQILYNVASNVNMPQVNLGTSALNDSIRIINCNIIGNRENIMAGGIAITTLAGGNLKARIQGNVIKDNRYGITAYGNNVESIIEKNEIVNNNTQNLPLLGGSGINFFGNTSNQSVVAGNIITGNLWGITIQQQAQPNFGQLEGTIVNPGENQIFDNGNEGEVFNLYNNTPNNIMAQNNWWGSADPDTVEGGIFHQFDNPSLGEVTYLPLFDPPVSIYQKNRIAQNLLEVFPNPATNYVVIKINELETNQNPVVELIDAGGKIIDVFQMEEGQRELKIELSNNYKGVLCVRLITTHYSETRKVIFQ